MAAHFAEHLCPWLSKPHARYTLHKTAHEHRSQVRKRTITRKSELLAPWLGLQSTVHTNKTGNKTDRKRHVPQLTERVHSLLYQTRMLLTYLRVPPGISNTKGRAKERGTGPLPCGCVCLATTNIASLYLRNRRPSLSQSNRHVDRTLGSCKM